MYKFSNFMFLFFFVIILVIHFQRRKFSFSLIKSNPKTKDYFFCGGRSGEGSWDAAVSSLDAKKPS